MKEWQIYKGNVEDLSHKERNDRREEIERLPPPPPWRRCEGKPKDCLLPEDEPDPHYVSSGDEEVMLVNAALYLRRPLMVTGEPGCGKSSLARSVAHELGLGKVLHWPITSRSTLQEGLYSYDAVGRLQESNLLGQDPGQPAGGIGNYIRLGALGTAFLPTKRPRVLLIDEIDKSDVDLPNDLLHIFEEATYKIPELLRLAKTEPAIEVSTYDGSPATINSGTVTCSAFPFVLMTSNGEKDFPKPFLRRCIRIHIPQPGEDKLAKIVEKHMETKERRGLTETQKTLIKQFVENRGKRELATDQLLNAIYIVAKGIDITNDGDSLREHLFKSLSYD